MQGFLKNCSRCPGFMSGQPTIRKDHLCNITFYILHMSKTDGVVLLGMMKFGHNDTSFEVGPDWWVLGGGGGGGRFGCVARWAVRCKISLWEPEHDARDSGPEQLGYDAM